MESHGIIGVLATAFQLGGPAMWLIAISFGFAVAFSFEKWVRLAQANVNGNAFMFEVQKYILANDLDGAIRVCNGAGKGAALPRVIKAGLQRASRDQEQIQNAIDAASLEVIPKLERRIPYLALIANIATLLGLLGTITGLIKSFAAVSVGDPAQRQAILANGISEAMYATAFGLVTAIFTMVMHSILSNKSNKILEEIDEFGVKLLDLLSARKFRHSSEKAGE